MNRIILAAVLAAGVALSAQAQTYQDSGGTVVPGVVPIQPGVGPLFTSANPGKISGSFSASLSGFQPTPSYASLSVGVSSSRVALPSGTVVVVYNTGTNPAYVTIGGASVTATTSNDFVPAGGWMAFTVGSSAYLAGIETAGATTLNLSGGSGLPTGACCAAGGAGGGSNASVGSTGSAVPGSATLGGMSVGGTMTAMPGTSNGLKIDGSAVTQPVSAASLPLPSGAATAANQTNVQSAAGSSASTAITIQGNASGVAVPVTGTLSASIGGFAPNGNYVNASVTTSSANHALPTGTVVVAYNTGDNPVNVQLGSSSVSVTSTTGDVIQPGSWTGLTVGSNTYIAYIGVGGASSIQVSGGAGIPTGSVGNGSVGTSGVAIPSASTLGGMSVGGTMTAFTGTSAGLKVDASGANLNINNATMGSTGSSVPGSAAYIGGNLGGNLTGLTLTANGLQTTLAQGADATGVAGANTLTAADSVSTSSSTNQNGQTFWTGVPTANSAVVFNVAGWRQAAFSITGTFSATVNSECTADSPTKQTAGTAQWVSCSLFIPGTSSSNFNAASVFTAQVEDALLSSVGLTAVRFRVPSGGYISGTVTVTANETINQRLQHLTGASFAFPPGNITPKDAVYAGARAENAEPTPASNGNLTGLAVGLEGKLITLPFANKENMVRGSASQTGTSTTTLIAAQGSGVKIYVTGVQCKNTGPTTTIVTLNDSASSVLIAPTSGGDNEVFQTPLAIAANTPLTFTPSASSSTIYCNAQGYAGS